MRKCPNCAEENINDSVFCENCGRCLLAPDPEQVQWVTVPPTEYHKTREGIEFYDRHSVKKSSAASLKRRPQTAPSVIVASLLLLNLFILFLMFEIARAIVNG